jgi:hypothetical protein
MPEPQISEQELEEVCIQHTHTHSLSLYDICLSVCWCIANDSEPPLIVAC